MEVSGADDAIGIDSDASVAAGVNLSDGVSSLSVEVSGGADV